MEDHPPSFLMLASRCRIHDRLGSNIAAAPRPILDEDLLAKLLGERFTNQPRHDADSAAGCEPSY
jgi:hypothetical protein